MIDVLEILKRIEAEKREHNIVPCIVRFAELQNAISEQVKAELNQAVKDGWISFHRTLNDISFGIKQEH